MKHIVRSTRKEILLMILLGLVVLSPISTILSQNYLHLPLALPEIFAMPILFLIRKRFHGIRLWNAILSNVWIIFLLIIIALIAGYFPFFAILSNARAWLYLLVCFTLFSRYDIFDTNDMLYLSFGALVGWLLAALMNISAISSGAVSGDASITTTGLMLSLPIFISLVIQRDNRILLWSGIAVLIGIMVFSGIRRAIFVIVISFALSVFLSMRNNLNKFFKYIFLIGALYVIFITLMPIVSNWVKDFSSMLYIRVFHRTEVLLTEGIGASDDNIRTNNMQIFFSTFYEYLIPRGFVSLQTATDSSTGIFNDLPILQISWIFSLPISLFFVLKHTRVIVVNYRRFKINNSPETMMCIICSVVMLCLLFLEGTYLTFAFAAPITGAMLGWANRISKYKV